MKLALHWLALVALALSPAAAQDTRLMVPKPSPVVATPPKLPSTITDPTGPWDDPVKAKAEIEKLKAENKDLKLTLDKNTAQLNERRAKLDAAVALGGVKTPGYCSQPNVAMSRSGKLENCGNFACSPVEGVCLKRCTVTADCAKGICNPSTMRCE